MKQRSKSGKRTAQQLSESLHQRLNMYALAASAAGVGRRDNALLIGTVAVGTAGLGLLAGVPAEAKIVYTPVDVNIGVYYLNLNGSKAFRLSNHGTHATSTWGYAVSIGSAHYRGKNRIVGKSGSRCASALHAGVEVGTKGPFGGGLMAEVSYRTHSGRSNTTQFRCPWANGGKGVENRYLGLKFYINGRVHFGWARLSVRYIFKHGFNALLTGYAYETIPNKSIIAGKTHGKDVITVEPATLGHLAQGASGLSAWRRTNSVAAPH